MSANKVQSKIAKFIFSNSSGVPMNSIAEGIGMSNSYLSEILNGKREPSVEICNKIADYFGVPRTKIYMLMGWIEEKEIEDQLQKYIEMARRDPNFRKLADLYATFDTPGDQKKAIRVLQSLLENEENKTDC